MAFCARILLDQLSFHRACAVLKILQICYEYPPLGGGGGQVAASLAQELAQKEHQVDFVTMWYRGLPINKSYQGVVVHRIPCLRFNKTLCRPPEMFTYLLAALPATHWLVKHNKFDINHTHFIYPDGIISWMIKKLRGLPYVITAHGSDVPGYNPNRFKLMHRILFPLWRRVVEDADGIVSPSESLSQLIHFHAPNKQVHIIPNGFRPGLVDFVNKKRNHILIVTRMFERKGVQYFLRALDGLDLPFQVDVVGDGPYLPELKKIMRGISSADQITFHGWLENGSQEFNRLFQQASIFVLPSAAENFPVVLLEAMAAGLAIITTRGTGCEEVVGEHAILVEPCDTAGLQKALRNLLTNPELVDKLRKLGRQRVETRFNWSGITDKYIDIYEKAISPI